MKKYIYIQADTNDANYVTTLKEISDEDLELILPVINAIKKFEPYKTHVRIVERTHRHNFPYGECLREDLGEKNTFKLYGHLEGYYLFMEEFVPCDDYGIHTINEIRILNVESEETLL